MPKAWKDLIGVPKSEKIPEGFKTTDEIAKELGRSRDYVRHMLNEALGEGTVERQIIRVFKPGAMNSSSRAYWRIK